MSKLSKLDHVYGCLFNICFAFFSFAKAKMSGNDNNDDKMTKVGWRDDE